MTVRPRRLRRCQLAVPGSSEKMMKKAAALDIDYVFLDLEDAVAYSEKPGARHQIVNALNTLDWGKKTRCVRVNDLTTAYAYEDIVEIVEGARENLDVIMLPKAMNAGDIQFVDRLLTMLERKLGMKKRIGLEVLIEEVEAMMVVEEIAAASPRLESLIFGIVDYSASQGILMKEVDAPDPYPGDIYHYQRQKLTIACRANGIDAVDGPSADFSNLAPYREECRRALALGMVGKWAIHPAQAAPAHEIFTPHPDDVLVARNLMKAYEEAQEQGLGAVRFEGKMIDVASVRLVKNLVDKADLIGM